MFRISLPHKMSHNWEGEKNKRFSLCGPINAHARAGGRTSQGARYPRPVIGCQCFRPSSCRASSGSADPGTAAADSLWPPWFWTSALPFGPCSFQRHPFKWVGVQRPCSLACSLFAVSMIFKKTILADPLEITSSSFLVVWATRCRDVRAF